MAPPRTSEGCWPAAWLQQVQQDHNVVPFALVRSFKEAKSRLSEQAYAARFSTCLTSLESWPPVSRRSPPVIRCTPGSSRAIRYESRQRLHALRCRAHRFGCDRRFLPQRSGRRRSSWTGTGRVRRGQKLVALERGCPRGEDANALLCARPGSSRSHNSGGVRKQSEDEVRVVSAWARYVHARLRTVVE